MKLRITGILIVLYTLAVIVACSRDKEAPSNLFGFTAPSNFPDPVYTGGNNNSITRARFELGRRLFYDPILSKDSTISCATCHQQFAAFANLDHTTSHGIYGLFGIRNAPAVQNMAWMPEFMWDGGVNHIEIMPLAPLTNPVEMDESIPGILEKLNRSPMYKTLFQNAFRKTPIDDQQMYYAFAQFMTCMVSSNSKYDKYVRGESGGTLTVNEQEGLLLFQNKCASCHATDLFTDYSYRNNGLSATASDSGRIHITLLESDRNKFKVPSLRNVALTRPYMHDGRFATLDQVLDHYDTGVHLSPTLDPLLQQGGYTGIELTEDEKDKIILFLNTLSDKEFIKDPKFSDPF